MSQALATPTEGVAAEERISFERLYRSSRDDVYAYAAGLLRDGSAAEEVTATAFERAYRNRSRFDPRRGSARAWLFGIARNAALDELRRRRRQSALVDEPVDLAGIDAEHPVERSERRLAVAAALERSRRPRARAGRAQVLRRPRQRRDRHRCSASPSPMPEPGCTES